MNLVKDINPSLLPPDVGKIVRQAELSNFARLIDRAQAGEKKKTLDSRAEEYRSEDI